MAEFVWAVLCHKAVIDKDSNQISLMDVLESFHLETSDEPEKAGALGYPLQVATLWTRTAPNEPERVRGRAIFVLPSGKSHPLGTLDINLETSQNCRAILKMQGIPVEGSGQYLFIIEKEDDPGSWVTMARIPLSITIVESGEANERPKD